MSVFYYVTKVRPAVVAFAILGTTWSCKTSHQSSAVEDIRLSPNYPGLSQTIWMTKDRQVHLGNCRDCAESKDAAAPMSRADYEIKIRNAVLEKRPGFKSNGNVPGLKEVQEKLAQMVERLKATGVEALNQKEQAAFSAQIAVLEQVLKLTEEEKKGIKDITDFLDTSNIVTFNQGLLKYDLAKAPFESSEPLNARIQAKCDQHKVIGVMFCEIPKGTFTMGAPEGEVGSKEIERPSHLATVEDFEILATEVTVSIWAYVCSRNCDVSENSLLNRDGSAPMSFVSRRDIEVDFLPKLNQLSAGDGYTYRLPTEEEWEYAARGGRTGPYGVAGAFKDFAWFKENSSHVTHPVAQLAPNGFGLFDMHGNVMEWVSASLYSYGPDDAFSRGLTRELGILRGGSVLADSAGIRSAVRYPTDPSVRSSITGFRVVRVKKK